MSWAAALLLIAPEARRRATAIGTPPSLTTDADGVRLQGTGPFISVRCKAAGVPHFDPHDLRHRRISIWHQQGVPVKAISERVGHARASMTLDTYSHVMPLDEVSVEQLVARLSDCERLAVKLRA